MFWPCETRTSTCRSFATISSGLYRFLAIAVLLDVRDIPQVGPLQWGWITSASANLEYFFAFLGNPGPVFVSFFLSGGWTAGGDVGTGVSFGVSSSFQIADQIAEANGSSSGSSLSGAFPFLAGFTTVNAN